MGNKGKSSRNLLGGYTNYDSKGNKVSRSDPNIFGGYTIYDNHGKKIGRSDPSFFGGYNHYDSKGNKVGHSDPNLFGGFTTYDRDGNKTNSSPNFTGGYSHNEGGCYVATCVYGSYDCPQVWTLRRFRDDILARTQPGRLFIRTYYAVSPTIVRRFGGTQAFRSFWKLPLDYLVKKLNTRGIADTPYQDKHWKR